MGMDGEKLLLGSRPVILGVVDAMRDSRCFGRVLAATSPNSPGTARLLRGRGVEVAETPGAGYAEDLNCVLRDLDGEVLVVSGDMALLDGRMVRAAVEGCRGRGAWTSVLVTDGFFRSQGLEGGCPVTSGGTRCHYTGISLVDAGRVSSLGGIAETHVIIDDMRAAFSLNTQRDLALVGGADDASVDLALGAGGP